MDVHAATPFLRARLERDGPRLGLDLRFSAPDWNELQHAISTIGRGATSPESPYWAGAEAPVVHAALVKIWNRRELRDQELGGAYASAFFLDYWRLCETRFPDLRATVTRELVETGQTCLQGDSHRFLQLQLAVLEDFYANAERANRDPPTEPVPLVPEEIAVDVVSIEPFP
jgi:hypothetical protein